MIQFSLDQVWRAHVRFDRVIPRHGPWSPFELNIRCLVLSKKWAKRYQGDFVDENNMAYNLSSSWGKIFVVWMFWFVRRLINVYVGNAFPQPPDDLHIYAIAFVWGTTNKKKKHVIVMLMQREKLCRMTGAHTVDCPPTFNITSDAE